MGKVCFLLCFLISAVTAISPQDGFTLRRITEFWKDRDYDLVKEQALAFLAANPETPVADNLFAILGDLAFQEDNLGQALAYYEKITSREFQEKTLFRRVHCLYENKDFDGAVKVAMPFFEGGATPKIDFCEDIQFLLADSLFSKMVQSSDLSVKAELAAKAKPLYQSFTTEQYKNVSSFPLAEIHRTLGELPQACALYAILAEKYPDKKEELLLQVATLQLSFDKASAIDTFGQIYRLKGSKAHEAAYNQLVLLFQEGKYAELISAAPDIASHIAPNHVALLDLCVGRSYFTLGRFAEAATALEKYTYEEREATPQKKAAFVSLITCAQKTGNASLFDRSLEEFLTSFPRDAEAAQVLLLHAQSSLQKGNRSQAIADLSRLLTQFPDCADREGIMYDRALLLAQSSNWEESREAFLAFVQAFPECSKADTAWGYIVNSSIHQLKECPLDKQGRQKEQLAQDLAVAVSRMAVFTEEEKPAYHLLLGKTYFELHKYEEALATFQTYLNAYPQNAGEVHLLAAHCLKALGSDRDGFIFHSEQALALQSSSAERVALHLELFNTYLAAEKFDKAADHLYQCYLTENHPVQLENLLWMANYYYSEQKERAEVVLTAILKLNPHTQLHIDTEQTFLEIEALKLASLLSVERRVNLLASLVELQNKNPEAGWKTHRQALFELGKSYEALHDTKKALSIYDTLIETSLYAPSYFSTAALLSSARLLYTECREEERNEKNPQIMHVLSSLKDIQIQKKITSEPLHIEAALEYADIRAALASQEARAETSLFFLTRVKDDFTAQDETEYNDSKRQFPEKEALVLSYLKCVDAEILRLKALSAEAVEAEQMKNTAAAMLHEITAASSTTPYLRARAERLLQALRSS